LGVAVGGPELASGERSFYETMPGSGI